jgi:hypothetical protein
VATSDGKRLLANFLQLAEMHRSLSPTATV